MLITLLLLTTKFINNFIRTKRKHIVYNKIIAKVLKTVFKKNPKMNTDSSSIELDPHLAKRLFNEGAILVITGVPIGTEFGIDLCTYTSGERFRGIKMIPPGPHFVFCAAQGPYGDAAPRVGFVHFFKQREILVREWDEQNEELRERTIDDPELEKKRIRENILELDSFLGPYDYRFVVDWKNLTDCVTEEITARCSPKCGIVRTNIQLESCPDAERPRGSASACPTSSKTIVDESELLPNLKPIDGTAPRFTALPERVPKDATPADISRHRMDCCDAIDSLLSSFASSEDTIGEIQMSFVMFLIGYSVESLAHWRKFLNLLANSESAIPKYKEFYMKYLEILVFQLPHLPEELMEPNDRNTVYKDVRSLLLNASVCGLSVSANALMKQLGKKMNWFFEGLLEEDPEDMPVVVEV